MSEEGLIRAGMVLEGGAMRGILPPVCWIT